MNEHLKAAFQHGLNRDPRAPCSLGNALDEVTRTAAHIAKAQRRVNATPNPGTSMSIPCQHCGAAMPMNDESRVLKLPTDPGPLYILTCPSCDHLQPPHFILDSPDAEGRRIKFADITPEELAELQRIYAERLRRSRST